MQGIFQKENTDKALKYGIYRHLPTYEKIIRNLVSFSYKILLLFHFLYQSHKMRLLPFFIEISLLVFLEHYHVAPKYARLVYYFTVSLILIS